jgi:uncharacterized ferritin-like protein (DUF455 family)
MPFTAWAWRVLTGDTLADKLAPPEEGGPIPRGAPPDSPGRPVELALPARGAASARVPFPGDAALADPVARGRILHFFANHELLALELLALALVRHRDAPEAFRRGLVGILADEQRHLASYVARMGEVGVRFGDLPVNRYFWDALAATELRGFVAGLSLTFEQANLDFAAHYAAAFRRVGDEATAATLDGVLADEIRHVAHGLHWFDRWRPEGGTRWDAWVATLPPPLTPARARGPHFFPAPRAAAGLDPETIARLEVFGASRGRSPAVWTFHPEVEAEVAGLGATPTGARVTRDLAGLLVLLAPREDIVLLPRAPSPAVLAPLARAGFALPEVVEGGPAALAGRKLRGLHPWGWSPTVAATLASLDPGVRWDPRWKPLYDKTWAAARLAERPDLCDLTVVGVACTTEAALTALAETAGGEHGVVLKAPFGTSGRGMRRWSAPGALAWARHVLAAQGAVLVEPWLDRVVDLSVQLDVAADGSVTVLPWGRFLTDGRGRYRGAVLGRPSDDLPPDVRRVLADAHITLDAVARHLGRAMAERGFTGPAGIDAMVYRSGGTVRLKPLVELNPRITMGRVARALDRRVRRGNAGLWVMVTRDEVRAAGFPDLAAWAADLRARAPLAVIGEPPQVAGGALFTTDPGRAERVVTVLVVGPTLGEARAILGLDRP